MLLITKRKQEIVSLNLGAIQAKGCPNQKGASVFVVIVLLLVLTISAFTGAKSTMTMENISDNQLRKTSANLQAESLINRIMNDSGYMLPLIQEARASASEVIDDTYTATLPGVGTRNGSAQVSIKPRFITGWSSTEITSLVVQVTSQTDVNGTRSIISPTYQKIIVAE